MAESAPLFGKVQFGRLTAVNNPGIDALKVCEGMLVTFKITKSGANQRRRGFYWVMLDVASEALSDRTGSPWDAESLHDTLKLKLRLGEPLRNTQGEEVGFKLRSTSNRAMAEPERARWTDRCAAVLSKWLEVEIVELMNEARARNGGIGPEQERREAA